MNLLMTSLLISVAYNHAAKPDTNVDAPATYSLAYKFRKGDKLHYSVLQKTTHDSRQKQFQQTVREKVVENKHYAVVEVRDDGTFVLQTVFDRIQMEADFGPKKQVVFDSNKPAAADPPGFKSFRRLTARPQYNVTFKPNGELRSVRRLAGASSKQNSAGKDGSGASYLVILPDEPIRVGETWRQLYNVKVPVGEGIIRRIEILRTYRLNSVENNIARISYATSINSRITDPNTLALLSRAEPTGEVVFDIEAGRILGRTMKSDKTILNAAGPNSLVRVVSSRVERIAEEEADEQQAGGDKPAAEKPKTGAE